MQQEPAPMESVEDPEPASAPGMTTVFWHPDVHRQIAQEQLAFLSLTFQPRYQRDLALKIIDRAFSESGVRSYVVWEQQRKPDVIIRAWIPPGKNSDDVLDALRHEASREPDRSSSITSSAFDVKRMLSHHLWPTSLPSERIDEALVAGQRFAISGQFIGETPGEVLDLMRMKAVAPVAANASGVKFFIWLTLQDLLPSDRARSEFENELIHIVHSVPRIFATAIYSGRSGRAHYLVTGRFKPENYEILARVLQPQLSNLGTPFIATNTDTSLSTLFGPIDRVEALPPPSATAESSRHQPLSALDQLLESEESTVLEFKGSAFTPLNVDGRVVSDQEYAATTKKVRDSIVKSVSGFLNTAGGTLVIGVLESARVGDQSMAEQLTNKGSYSIIGIDETIDGKKATWDVFERRLRQLISDAITPSPDPWMSITRGLVAGRDVAVVTVQEPSTWFWAKTSTDSDVFFVRYGSSTQPLRGPAQRHHMKSLKRDD